MKKAGDIIEFIKQRDYIMVNPELGEGSFGKTVLLKDPFIDELFVAKKYEPESEEDRERFYKNFLDEIKIMYRLNHRNVVRIFNYYPFEKIFTGYILMEYIDGNNIGDFISNYAPWDDTSLDDVFSQLIDGFCYIESHGIIHRDIREMNILVDKTGVVKIIDFGIGKLVKKGETGADSLANEINRANSDTLPQEYYEGVYTSKTDMFYLSELLNRLIKSIEWIDESDFSYFDILEKMMKKNPSDRYSSFIEIRETIDKYDFVNLEITQADKEIYQGFANFLYRTLASFIDERKFKTDISHFISTLEKALQDNCFEDEIQNNSDILRSVIIGAYRYNTSHSVSCEAIKNFLNWYKKLNQRWRKLVLNNIIIKLSMIDVVESEPELPF